MHLNIFLNNLTPLILLFFCRVIHLHITELIFIAIPSFNASLLYAFEAFMILVGELVFWQLSDRLELISDSNNITKRNANNSLIEYA